MEQLNEVTTLPNSIDDDVVLTPAEQLAYDEIMRLDTAAKLAIQQQRKVYGQDAGNAAGTATEDPAALDRDDQIAIARAIVPLLALAENCPDPYIATTMIRSFIYGLTRSVQYKLEQMDLIREETTTLLDELDAANAAGNMVKANRVSELVEKKTEFFTRKQAEIDENELWARSCKALWRRLTGKAWEDHAPKAANRVTVQANAARALMGITSKANPAPKKGAAAKTKTAKK